MKKKNKPDKQNSRRNFLKTGLTAGIAGLAGGVGLMALSQKTSAKKAGQTIKLLTPDGKLVELDKSVLDENSLKPAPRKEAKKGLPNRKFVMVIDLSKCKNARKCVDACQEGHYLPKSQEWMRLYLLKDSPETAPYWFPRPCFHCDNPLCVSVCPVGATYKRSDGIVLVDGEKCIGCKFCMTGCPYSVRVFQWEKPEVPAEIAHLDYSPETNLPPVKGTVGKCVFCADKLRKNELPRCVQACPMGVIYFGDINEDTVTNGEETVQFSELIKNKAGYRHLETLGTRPSVYYLPPVNRGFPVERGLEGYEKELVDRYKDVPLSNINNND